LSHNPIFICDDEQEILRYLKKLFEMKGMQVETFCSGETLLGRLQDPACPSPRLLIQDIHLGEENGIDIAREVRKIEPGLPVIMITGYNSAEAESRAFEAGARAFLPKPFPKERLLEVVEGM